MGQERTPRPLRQSDMEKALPASRNGNKVASGTASGFQSPVWTRPSDPEDDQLSPGTIVINQSTLRIKDLAVAISHHVFWPVARQPRSLVPKMPLLLLGLAD